MDVLISDKATGATIGRIGQADFRIMADRLEEESSHDTDYFIDPSTIDILEAAGASEGFIQMLRDAVGTSEGIDIAWESLPE